jgi:predicted phage baseplate assembly protein
MSLAAPNLDDRRFQDIVDEAKRLIPRFCPEWTDHNLSDPGITLVELFAWMTEMILYRVNQIPDKHYAKFLDLMGIQLFPAAPAGADIIFWLSATQPEAVRVHAGSQVGTLRTEQDESVIFMTDEDVVIVVPTLTRCVTSTGDGRYENHWDDLRIPGETVKCFSGVTRDDAVYFGFEESLANNVVRLEFQASIEGIGVQPDDPPWTWEAWSGEVWVPARVHGDDTGGLNRDGAVTLFVPRRHEPLTVGPARAHWLRCRMLEPRPKQPGYSSSPKVSSLDVSSLGAIAVAHHAQAVPGEPLGRSDGTPGQWFTARKHPVLPRDAEETVEIITSEGSERWSEVEDFASSGPEDRHFTWNGGSGEVRFGPRVAYPDGRARQHGAIPAIDSQIRLTGYRHGGGSRGNVGGGTLTVLKSSIPFIARVENIEPATGGVDAETIENAKVRGPLSLRTGQRAVTAQDFERLTLEAAPTVARARCLPPAEPGSPVRVLIVPRVELPPQRLALDDLALSDILVERVTAYLEERRILTSTVTLGTPYYQGLTVVAQVNGGPGADPELVRDRLLSSLYRYVNPLVGGPGGEGWPFGRTINVGEIFALLAGVEGVATVEEVRIFLADLRTGERREGRQRAQLEQDAVFASYQHQVLVR